MSAADADTSTSMITLFLAAIECHFHSATILYEATLFSGGI